MLTIVPLFLAIAVLSGCGAKDTAEEKNKVPNPIQDPAGYVPGMMDVKKQAEKNINDSVKKENDKINEALGETNTNKEPKNMTNLKPPVADSPLLKKYTKAKISTSLGDVTVQLDSAKAPLAVANFLNLAENKFYDGAKFHRVIKGFMIQGGDPNSKNADTSNWGMGGPGYAFQDELTGKEKYPQGTLAMANSGPNTNGSQFFIVTAGPEAPLSPNYTVFGKVTEGLDIALKIENVKTTGSPYDRPLEDVLIKSVTPLDK